MADKQSFPLGANATIKNLEIDMHQVLHQLRSSEPVSWVPAINAWVISRYDLTTKVMRDAKTYTVDHPGFSTGQVVGPSMLSLDGHQHKHHRLPFEAPFRKREVMERFSHVVADTAADLIQTFKHNKQAELRRAYAGPIAVKTMIVALGLEDSPVATVLGWYDTIVDAVTRVTAGEPVSAEGRAAYAALQESLMPSLRKEQEASLLAAAAGAADGLTDDQIISNAAILLFGGIETTEGMITNAIYHLLSSPRWQAKATADPALLPAVVEESLRLEPAAAVVDRYATADISLAGADIKKDDLVQVSLAGANRDPAVFAQPDNFDPSRPNLKSHVTFAQGPHVCLGIHLARLEAHDALEVALRELPNLRFANQTAQGGARPRGLIFRKSPRLDVCWD